MGFLKCYSPEEEEYRGTIKEYIGCITLKLNQKRWEETVAEAYTITLMVPQQPTCMVSRFRK
jgi:hypothetical protein